MSGPSMRKAIFVLIVLLPLAVFGQYVSYWFQGWQRQGNARDAQEYFMVPGAGIYFTYATTNRVIINAYGTNVVNTNYVLKAGDTMTGTLTNVSDLIIIRGSNQVATLTFEVPNPSVPGNFIQAILQFSTNNVFSISSVSNYIKAPTYITKVYGDGGGLTNVHASSVSGTLTNDTTGNAAFATNASSASFATNASNATNFWGTLSNTNLPAWVAYTTSNQTFTASNAFNGSGFTVGTNLIAIPNISTSSIILSAGSANTIIVTNGRVGLGIPSLGAKLQVTQEFTNNEILSLQRNSAWPSGSHQQLTWRDNTGIAGAIGMAYNSASASVDFMLNSMYSTGYRGTSTVPFIVKGTGFVGIDWLTPTALLQSDTLFNAQYADDGSKPTWLLSYSGTQVISLFMGTTFDGVMANPYNGASAGGLHFRTGGATALNERLTITKAGNVGINVTNPLEMLHVYGTAMATNFVTSAVKWVDIPMNYGYSVLGPNAPALTEVTNSPNNSAIQALAFDNGDMLYAQAQFPHTVAITNASFPSFYIEPHVHFDTIGTLDSTHSNVTWRIEWQLGAINGTWYSGTNSATMGVTNNFTHYVLDLGHITNNAPLGISTIFRCRLMRPASASQDYSNAHDVLLDGFDLHVPVGNRNAIGSSTDNAP